MTTASALSPLRAAAPDAIVVLCAVPVDFPCEELAGELVRAALAACVQIGPPITSVYGWKGQVETSAERLLILKTRASRFGALEAAIRARHPYEVPEIVALPLVAAHAPYLAWLEAMTARRIEEP